MKLPEDKSGSIFEEESNPLLFRYRTVDGISVLEVVIFHKLESLSLRGKLLSDKFLNYMFKLKLDKSVHLRFNKFAQMSDHFVGAFALASFIVVSREVVSAIFFPVRL